MSGMSGDEYEEQITPARFHAMPLQRQEKAIAWMAQLGYSSDNVMRLRWFGGAVELDVIRARDERGQPELIVINGKREVKTDLVRKAMDTPPSWWPKRPTGRL